jgi:hypothetical protein
VRWSHVGKYESHIILFDLADQIDLKTVDNDIATNEKIRLLNSRAGL